MPLHDWTRVEAGIYHGFHTLWIGEMFRRLSTLLPANYYCYPELYSKPDYGDVIALEYRDPPAPVAGDAVGTALLTAPAVRIVQDEPDVRAEPRHLKVRRIQDDCIVAVIQLVSPANKHSRASFGQFIDKVREYLDAGVHLLIIDPYPPSPRDPFGLHAAIVEDRIPEPHELDAAKDRCAVAYECRPPVRAYLEPLAIGDPWPTMPVFLQPGIHVALALEETYAATFRTLPRHVRAELALPTP